jgi:predicted ATP-grasp superfamily ATP-dependent carboligase
MRLKILFSEGSSLSAREAITTLGRSGHTVDICAPTRWCLGSFSKWVRRVHLTPALGADPDGYARAVAQLCDQERVDVLLPVHEQAYLFAALRESDPSWPTRNTAVPVAPFRAFAALQTKSALSETLAAVGLPQPATFLATSPEELRKHGDVLLRADGACIVKVTFGTASTGVHRLSDHQQLEALCTTLATATDWDRERAPTATEPVVVQQAVAGALERLQAIFAEGTLVAIHSYRQLLEGPGGGDVLKESVSRPIVVSHMQVLGAHLRWHGALAFDYILPSGCATPVYIDANPRLVEPVNASLSGVDLAETLLQVALGENPGALVIGRAGVRTRLGIPGLLERAATTGRRSAVIGDFIAQLRTSGRYAGTVEELTPYDDVLSLIPLGAVLMQLLTQPAAVPQISRDTIDSYALGDRGHHFVRELLTRGITGC